MDPGGAADVSVRPARSADASAIAEVQLQTWRSGYAEILPSELLDAIPVADAEARWRDAVIAPPSRAHGLLVALHGGRLVGFVAFGPGEDEDTADDSAELFEILVGPGFQQAGHGSRLLSAAVDRLEAEGFGRVVAWRFEADEPAQQFLRSAGWALDGSRRTLDVGGDEIVQVRLHTEIGVSVSPL
jgi:ribosomal protein S18 acetylase RimI-like enzyme